jgi:predicted GNAT superfamily acetyltransferase/predicted enzyme related to lactoylglutathione lyase
MSETPPATPSAPSATPPTAPPTAPVTISPVVRELRLVVTASDYDEALRFYRDVVGLPERAAFASPGGRVTILEAGRATLELADPPHAAYIDEVEVGRRVAGHIRVALAVADSRAATRALAAAGAEVLAEPTRTPWNSLNARLSAPAGLQLTLFSEAHLSEADLSEAGLVAAAAGQARAAADTRGLRVVELTDLAEQQAATRLLAEIWGTGGGHEPLTAETIRALAHSGNYVSGAYRGGTLVGTAVAFLGAGHLHSHIAGVAPEHRAAGVGYVLKQHQRAWALARGIPEVHWTFDPLVRRNAYFNLHRLGATAVEYLPDFYGAMTDGINAGDASDRLYVAWRLASPRAVSAAEGERSNVDTAGAVTLLDVAGERPVPAAGLPGDGRPILVAVPADIEGIRVRDRGLAARWRQSVRQALAGAMAGGYQITGVSRDGYYRLERGASA